MTIAAVRPTIAIAATTSSAFSCDACERRTIAGCCAGTALPMTASWIPGRAAPAACPVFVLCGGDHAGGRLLSGDSTATGRQTPFQCGIAGPQACLAGCGGVGLGKGLGVRTAEVERRRGDFWSHCDQE